MTEAEWQSGRGAKALVDHLARRRKNRPSDRKLRLVMCAACRLVWDEISDPVARQGIEAVEQFADGLTTAEEVSRVDKAISRSGDMGLARAAAIWSTSGSWRDPSSLTIAVCTVVDYVSRTVGEWDAALARLVRCVVGNLFRPVTLDPVWRTDTVVALAQGIYHDRAFDRMPILADALQDAGCDNDDVLTHCRDAGPHARGCWVVDLVLSKV